MYRPDKKSPAFYAKHYRDIYTDLGFDYRGKIFQKTMSKGIFENANNASILAKAETMVLNLVENVKQIRTYFLFSVNKDEHNVN